MRPRYAIANFACIVIVIQIFVSLHIVRILSCREHSFVDALNSLRTTFEHTYVKVVHQTDTARATVMAADPTILALPTFPEHYKEWADWMDAVLDKSQTTVYSCRNADGEKEECSYYTLVLFGLRWNAAFEMWLNNQDIAALTAQALLEHGTFSANEEAHLREDEDQAHWNNARHHRTMQIRLKTAIVTAMKDSPFRTEINFFARTLQPNDLYQGSRILSFLTEKLNDFLATKRAELLQAAMLIAPSIKENLDIEASEVHDQVNK